MKLLVTGSRSMPYRLKVMNAISLWYISREDDPEITLLTGDCPDPPLEREKVTNKYLFPERPRTEWSVDQVAKTVAMQYHWKQQHFAAEWYNSCTDKCYHRKYASGYCPAAGPIRNKMMVDMLDPETDVCLGFPYGASKGTRGCIKLAEKAGIETITFEL